MFEELSDLQTDALIETINIGVGRASRAIAQLTKCEIAMTIPVIIQSLPENVSNVISQDLFGSADVCSVGRRIAGLDAEITMIFQASKESMAEVLVTSGIVSEAQGAAKDAREAVANKMGYLVIESCLDQIENLIGRDIERIKLSYNSELPASVFSKDFSPRDPVIIVKIDVSIPKRCISGHLLFSVSYRIANKMADGLDAMVIASQSQQ